MIACTRVDLEMPPLMREAQLIAEIERLRAVISNTRAIIDHVIHGEVSITSMQDIYSDLSKALGEQDNE
jgi:hypothetical protein